MMANNEHPCENELSSARYQQHCAAERKNVRRTASSKNFVLVGEIEIEVHYQRTNMNERS